MGEAAAWTGRRCGLMPGWRPVRDSNPCTQRERLVSWASRRTGRRAGFRGHPCFGQGTGCNPVAPPRPVARRRGTAGWSDRRGAVRGRQRVALPGGAGERWPLGWVALVHRGGLVWPCGRDGHPVRVREITGGSRRHQWQGHTKREFDPMPGHGPPPYCVLDPSTGWRVSLASRLLPAYGGIMSMRSEIVKYSGCPDYSCNRM